MDAKILKYCIIIVIIVNMSVFISRGPHKVIIAKVWTRNLRKIQFLKFKQIKITQVRIINASSL